MYIGLKLHGGHCGTLLATLYMRGAFVVLQSCYQGRCSTHSAAYKHGGSTFVAKDTLSHIRSAKAMGGITMSHACTGTLVVECVVVVPRPC